MACWVKYVWWELQKVWWVKNVLKTLSELWVGSKRRSYYIGKWWVGRQR